MKKRGIILIIILLVVANISTYCGYGNGKIRRAESHKEELAITEIDSAKILKISQAGDSVHYNWKKLTEEQTAGFIAYWHGAQGTSGYKPVAAFQIQVYIKNKKQRIFKVLNSHIQEGRFVYWNFGIDKDYFENLYQNAGGK